MYKLKVNREKCNACGACTLECDILQEDAAGIVEVIGEGIVADSEVSKIKNIVELCPTGALTLAEDFVDVSKKISELKAKMEAPLKFTPPSAEEYSFRYEDMEEYGEAIKGSPDVSGEWEYDYKSWDSAKSAGKRAFRDEIYSQADALAQQVVAMYEQRRVNRVARYAEVSGNYKYGVHQRLIKDLRSFVNELENYTGKKISLSPDFFSFRTKDTEYINDRQDHANEWLADSIKNHLKPASDFETCVKVEKTQDYVLVSGGWFSDDKYKWVTKYAYYIDSDSLRRFYRNVARATWKGGKYTSKFCESELWHFHREIEEEWVSKINYLFRQFGIDGQARKNYWN